MYRGGNVLLGRSKVGLFVVYVVLVVFLLFTLAPFYWVVVCSLKSAGELFTPNPRLFPEHPTLENYASLVKGTRFLKWVLNSVVVSAGSTVLGGFFCSLAGFAFCKYQFRGKNMLFWVILGSVAIPQMVTLIPMFALMSRLGWVDTYQALILPGAVNAFGIFLMRQYMATVPDELMDASRIDGCSEFQIFLKVVLPIVKPGLGALAVFLWLTSWTSYLWPLVMTSTEEMYTIPLGLATLYANPWNIDYGPLMAGAALSVLPVVILFLSMQRQFIAGLTEGAVKG